MTFAEDMDQANWEMTVDKLAELTRDHGLTNETTIALVDNYYTIMGTLSVVAKLTSPEIRAVLRSANTESDAQVLVHTLVTELLKTLREDV